MPYRFEFDKEHRILRACIEGITEDAEITRFRAETTKLISDLQPAAFLMDFSDTKKYEVSSEIVRTIGRTPPALPHVQIPVILVAPAAHIFGMSRMFQITSEEKRPWVRVVKSSEEAFKLLQLETASFDPLV